MISNQSLQFLTGCFNSILNKLFEQEDSNRSYEVIVPFNKQLVLQAITNCLERQQCLSYLKTINRCCGYITLSYLKEYQLYIKNRDKKEIVLKSYYNDEIIYKKDNIDIEYTPINKITKNMLQDKLAQILDQEKIILREWQKLYLDLFIKLFIQGEKMFILIIPTGYGKTVLLNIISKLFNNPCFKVPQSINYSIKQYQLISNCFNPDIQIFDDMSVDTIRKNMIRPQEWNNKQGPYAPVICAKATFTTANNELQKIDIKNNPFQQLNITPRYINEYNSFIDTLIKQKYKLNTCLENQTRKLNLQYITVKSQNDNGDLLTQLQTSYELYGTINNLKLQSMSYIIKKYNLNIHDQNKTQKTSSICHLCKRNNFTILLNCCHCFCLDCLYGETEIYRRCPICKRYIHTVIVLEDKKLNQTTLTELFQYKRVISANQFKDLFNIKEELIFSNPSDLIHFLKQDATSNDKLNKQFLVNGITKLYDTNQEFTDYIKHFKEFKTLKRKIWYYNQDASINMNLFDDFIGQNMNEYKRVIIFMRPNITDNELLYTDQLLQNLNRFCRTDRTDLDFFIVMFVI